MSRPRATKTWIRVLEGTILGVAYSPDAPPGDGWTAYDGDEPVTAGWVRDGEGWKAPPEEGA